MLWFESQWLTDYCLAIPTILGSIKAPSRPITEPGPNSAPAQRSLNRKPAPDASPGGRWVFQMQHNALTRTRPHLPRSLPAQWTFFWARGQGRESIGGGGPSGSMNKVGYRSVVVVNQRHLGQQSPYMDVRQCIITIATTKKKKSFAFLCKCTHVLHLKICNHIQFAFTNNNTQSWKGHKQTSNNKIHQSWS